jgi:hypothetical protein
MRLVIAGGPRTGKTTIADAIVAAGAAAPFGSVTRGGANVLHTDDLIDLGWVPAGRAAAAWLDLPGPWVIEGVTAPRALRRWLKRNRRGKPCDVVLVLAKPRVPRTKGQEAMAKGCAKIMAEIAPALRRRGVKIVTRATAIGRRSRAAPARAAGSRRAARSPRRSRA